MERVVHLFPISRMDTHPDSDLFHDRVFHDSFADWVLVDSFRPLCVPSDILLLVFSFLWPRTVWTMTRRVNKVWEICSRGELRLEAWLQYRENVDPRDAMSFEEHTSGSLLRHVPTLIDHGAGIHYPGNLLSQMHFVLPRRCRHVPWRLVYSTQNHGVSIRTLLARCEKVSPVLLVLTDTKGNHFGAFCGKPLSVSLTYSGNAETFLWTDEGVRHTDPVTAYRWSRINQYFTSVRMDQIAFGGGGSGGFGLHINGDLLSGSTSPCTTFLSKNLVRDGNFEILALELWSF